MVKALNVMNEEMTNGIKIHIRGEEIDLNEIDPKELEAMLDELTDEEADAINDEIVAQIGQDTMDAIVAEVEAEKGLVKDDGAKQSAKDDKDDDDRLEPIMLDVPLGLTHDLEMLDKGINEASYLSGRYTAYVNAGMSSKQAYELIVMQLKHEHEELMFEKQAKVQLEIKEKDIKMALQLNGLKNILNED